MLIIELKDILRNEELYKNIEFFIQETFDEEENNIISEFCIFFKKICMSFGTKNISFKYLGEKDLYIKVL